MVKTKIQCPCGQENQLVLADDGWRYDQARHGNGDLCVGRCFNCREPLKDEEMFPAAIETEETPEPADDDVTRAVTRASMSMKRDELVGMAEEMGLEVPIGATKSDIIEMIEEAEDQGPEED